ncbi:MAG TPA: DUF4337 domain-containing protein [Candidatus Acidoferrales bacterium]|jgi:hypothetical protein|nr:DUF4337 domain-containing protein [Candidatus Acidoferrales bacterium]
MADELHELEENAEHGREAGLAPVTISMAILAVLVAVVSLLSHRTHTEEILLQTKASDQWAFYQAKNIRRHTYELFLDQLSVFPVKDAAAGEKMAEKYKKELERYAEEQKEIEAEARKLESEEVVEQHRVDRYDLGEVLLEVSLVIASITLLTRQRLYWGFALLLGAAGVVIAATGFLIR